MKREPFSWVNETSQKFLDRDYLLPGQTVEERVRIISDRAEALSGINGFSDKFFDYMSRGWISLSTPCWTNYATTRGMSVSCFGSYPDDTMDSILYTAAEVGMLSKFGGGTSGYFGALRPRGSKIKNNGNSFGSVHFMQLFDKVSNIVSQGSVRRGQFSPYLPIEHDDFDEFIEIGTDENAIQELKHGVIVSDRFMEEMINGNTEWRRRWAKVIQVRTEVGYPYVLFIDNANKARPDVYKEKEMYIKASNLCSEIMLPSTPDESFTCVLSSLNLLYYDEWKDTDLVEVMVTFLDTVCTEFLMRIDELDGEARNFMKRVYRFTERHRALGLGVLGWHSLLQSKMIPWDSKDAAKLNYQVFKNIQGQAIKASKKLAEELGEPLLLKGKGMRNTTLLAIAPTKSSSTILGQVTQGIEPEFSNMYVKDNAKVKYVHKNPILKEFLSAQGKDTVDVWASIKDRGGSVQHLEFLSDHEKEVFKTISEINQQSIIDQAAIRQEYICQGQSLNVMINPETPTKEINQLYIYAWKNGIKALYYQYSASAAQEFARDKLLEGCAACEG